MMWKWLQQIIKKKKNKAEEAVNLSICSNCIWWGAEEENNILHNKRDNIRFCDIHKDYRHSSYTCHNYKEERFEATSESIQTEELEINYNLSVEESDKVDTERER